MKPLSLSYQSSARGFRLAALAALLSPFSPAAVFNLTTDFSLASNPNGPWSYQLNGTNLSFFLPAATGNPGAPAYVNGFWSVGNDLNVHTPTLTQTAVDANSAGGNTTLDYVAGQIVAHSPNNGGETLFVRWTAPSAGTITSYAGSVWYAHSPVTRANDWAILLGSTTLHSGVVGPADNRTNASTYAGSALAVNAGDVFSIALAKSAGQSFGGLAGLTLGIDFAPSSAVPEPASFALVAGALALAWAGRRRQRDHVIR